MKSIFKFIMVVALGIVLFASPNNASANINDINGNLKGYEEAIKAKNYTNAALYSARIAEYYDQKKNYDAAVQYYEASHSYWQKTSNPDWGLKNLNRANEIRTEIEVYVEKNIELGHTLAKYEPASGLYIGLYTAGELEAPKVGETDFSLIDDIYGKNHAMYLTYTNWTKNEVVFPTAYAERVKEQGSALQIALQPMGGLDEVKDTQAIREFARQAQAMDMPIFLRFAGEMNGDWTHWSDKTGKKYIEKFRLVHDIFEQEAPNVAMVWAPNFYPYNNYETYYPGDKYVDWVGLSLYMSPYSAGQQKEVLGNSPIPYLKIISDLYPHKPLMYAEGAISHFSYVNGKDYTKWTQNQLYTMYELAPKMFPNLKAITYFNLDKRNTNVTGDNQNNNFDLGKNKTIYNTYKSIIASDFYIDKLTLTSKVEQKKTYTNLSYLKEAAGKHNAIIYAKLPLGQTPSYVAAYQGNIKVGQSNAAPWKMELDLSSFDLSKPLKVTAFDSSWKPLGSKEIKLKYKKVSELSHFKDVSASHWAFKDINTAVSAGIINGYMGNFNPNSSITIRDFVAILARSYGEGNQIGNAAYDADVKKYMQEKNFPYANIYTQTISRTQAAEIIVASQGVNLTGDNAIKYLLINDLSKGKNANSISVENYDGKAQLSRAETVKFLANVKANGNSDISTRPSLPTDTTTIEEEYNRLFK